MKKLHVRKSLFLGLASVAAVAAIALVPAMAQAAGPGPDPATWAGSVVQPITGSSSDLTLEGTVAGTSVQVDCAVTFNGTVNGGTSTDSIASAMFTGCTGSEGATGCTVTTMATNLPWNTNATKDDTGDFFDTIENVEADITFSGAGCPLGNPITVTATGTVTGVWVNGTPNTFTFQSDASATVTLSVGATAVGTGTLDGTFDVTGGTLM